MTTVRDLAAAWLNRLPGTVRSSIGLHVLDSNMIRRHDAANTVKPDERRPREQRKGWPSAEKNDENERVCENT